MKASLSFSIDRRYIWVYCGVPGRRGDRGHYIVRSPYPPDALPEGVDRVDSGASLGTERFDIELPEDVPLDLTGSRIGIQLDLIAGPKILRAPAKITLEIQGRPHTISLQIPLQLRGANTSIAPTTTVVRGILQAHNVSADSGMAGFAPPYVPVGPAVAGG